MKLLPAFALFLGLVAMSCCEREIPNIPPPEISQVTITPEHPSSSRSVTVKAHIFDIRSIRSAVIFYRTDMGPFKQIAMQPAGDEGFYEGTLPAHETGTEVTYYIQATNDSKVSAYHPAKAPESVESYVVSSGIFTIPITPKPLVRLPFEMYETSGITMTLPGKIWSNNDSGNENKLYCVDPTGKLLRILTLTNVQNTDWEDLAVDDQKRIYIGDAGNNDNSRTDLAIYRIPDPETIAGDQVTAEKIAFRFEDQVNFPPAANNRNFDIEGIIWHSDSIFMFTKDRSVPLTGNCRMYKIPARPGDHIARFAGQVNLGTTIPSARVTAADIHPATGQLALLVQERLIVFKNYPGNRFFDGDRTDYPFNPIPGQAEAIVFTAENKLFMTEEGSNKEYAGYLYELTLEEGN